MTELESNARAIRNAYYREWRAKNKDKVKKYNHNHWLNKAKSISNSDGHKKGENRE